MEDLTDDGLPDDETDAGKTWDRMQGWFPEAEPFDDEFLLEKKRSELPKLASVLPSEFTEFAFRMPKKDGMGYENFTFEGRRHMRDIYDTPGRRAPTNDNNVPARRILLFCGRQVEKSTLLGNTALCYSCLVPSFKTLYVSPSMTQTKTFSADRIKEPIETSPVLKSFTTSMLAQNVLEKQFVNRSKITLRFAFLNADRTRGIPAWMLMLDELQDIIHDNIPIIEQCLSHAPENWKTFVYAGTPKTLDNTIEFYWGGVTKHGRQMSTQHQWVVPCDRRSGEWRRFWNILGEKNIGKKGLSCERCGKLINPMHEDAQWAWTIEDAIFEGYRIPQLMVPWRSWDEILLDYGRYERPRFYNEVLGLSSDSGMRPLTMQNIKDCCNEKISMHPKHLEMYQQRSVSEEVYAGIDWGCHDEETRILTKWRGFVHFRDLTDEDEVAQWDPDTREMSYTRPVVRTVRDWDQPLYHFEAKGLDMMLSGPHRMRVNTQQGGAWGHWKTESAEEVAARGGNIQFAGYINWLEGNDHRSFYLPGLPTSQGYSGSDRQQFRMDDWLEFLGYYLSEGGLCYDGDRPSCLKMSQRETVNPEKVAKIRACFNRLGIEYSEFPNEKTGDINWTIYGKQFWGWVMEHVGTEGHLKRVPREFLQLSKRQLKILFNAMVLGDGSSDERPNATNGGYPSTSKGLCEDFQEICIKLGLRSTLSLHKSAEGNRRTQWRVSWSEGRDFQFNTPKRRVKRVPYQGKVYCCAVPSGYIVTERNGRIAYQGNTGENTYTVLSLGMYFEGKFRIFYIHRFVGEDLDPDIQIEKIVEILSAFNVIKVGCDYGGGYIQNRRLVQRFGPHPGGRVATYQYMARTKKKLEFDTKLGRFKVHRTEVMSDIFNAIKRQKFDFPRWEEFKEPHGTDMLNIFSEYNDTLRMVQYDSSMGKPDDSFHSVLYCFLASMLVKPRPDILTPKREVDEVGPIYTMYDGPKYQG